MTSQIKPHNSNTRCHSIAPQVTAHQVSLTHHFRASLDQRISRCQIITQHLLSSRYSNLPQVGLEPTKPKQLVYSQPVLPLTHCGVSICPNPDLNRDAFAVDFGSTVSADSTIGARREKDLNLRDISTFLFSRQAI